MISSTALDLPEHRAEVREACLAAGVFPIGMEQLPARDATGLAVSLEMVDKADLYLGIYAWRYGWVPDGSDISVTEMEFDRAIERQKAGQLRELFIFTAHDDHPFTKKDIETGDVAQQKLAAFKAKASNGRVRKEFSSVEELRRLVSEALHEFHLRENAKTKQPSPVSVVPVFSEVPSNLPGGYIGQVFVGREQFLEDLRNSLLKQTHTTAITQQRPAATVTEGLGGLGKTHAAVEYADKHRGDYTALLFVSGDTPQRLQSGLAALCEVRGLNLNENLPMDEAARASIALYWLATNPSWLLIVDNVDDEAAAVALRDHFEQLRSGHVLITSRLGNWSQQVDSLDLSLLSPDDATALLLQLTDKRRKAADDATQARTLAALMEGLPLALHQAAGYINERRLSFAQCLVTYQDEAAELLNWFNDLSIPYERPDKLAPRPVLITWKTSFDQLSPESRFWLLVFSHFAPDPIPEFLLDNKPDAADEVKTRHRAARKAIAQADKFNLLTRYDDPPRFKIHRLVQEVTRLSASEEERTTALASGIGLIMESELGDPQDVHTWRKWTPLQSHAIAICQHAPNMCAPEGLTWLMAGLSLLLQVKSLFAQAEPLMRRALEIDEASFGPEHVDAAPHLNNLAALLQATNRMEEAELMYRRAIEIAESRFGMEHSTVAKCLTNLASLLSATGRMEEAEPLMRRALLISEASYGPLHPVVAIHLNNLATLFHATKRLDEAERLLRRALQIDEASNGLNHPSVARELHNLALLLMDKNCLDEAELMLRRALQIDEDCYGPENLAVAINLKSLTALLRSKNMLEDAVPLMRRALKIEEIIFGLNHPNVAHELNGLAHLLKETNQREEAMAMMSRALQIDETSYGPNHPTVALRLNNLAMLLRDMNRLAEAEPLMRRALDICVRSLELEHPNFHIVRGNYIRLLMALELPEAEIERRVVAAVRGE